MKTQAETWFGELSTDLSMPIGEDLDRNLRSSDVQSTPLLVWAGFRFAWIPGQARNDEIHSIFWPDQ
jgi:hypothetical protein